MNREEHNYTAESNGTIDIRDSVSRKAEDCGLGTALRELFAPLGGIELEIPPRDEMDPTDSIFEEE